MKTIINQLFTREHIRHKISRTLSHFISLMMLYIIILSSFYPPLRSLSYINQIWAVCIIIWTVFAFAETPRYFVKPNTYRLVVYLFIFYTVSIAYLSGNTIIGNRYIETFQMQLFYMAYERNKLYGRWKENQYLIRFIIPIVLLTSVITLNAYRTNPVVSRSMKKATEVGIKGMEMGIGGYEFVYFIVFLFLILFNYIICKNIKIQIKKYITVVLICVILLINIVLSNFTTALLIVSIGIILIIIIERIPFKYLIIILPLMSISLFFYESIINAITGSILYLLDDSWNAVRVKEIRQLFLSGDIGSSFGNRLFVFNESIQSFICNPIFGSIKDPVINLNGETAGFGNHSLILDTFAMYGIGIGLLQFYIYFQPMVIRLRSSEGVLSSLSLMMLITVLIFFIVNITTPIIGLAIFFIYPTIYDLINNSKRKRIKHDEYII